MRPVSRRNRAAWQKVLGTFMGAVLASASFASAFNFAATTPGAAAAATTNETRAQFVAQLGQALCLLPTTSATQSYSDVASSDPDFGYIMAASAQGWISGFPDGTFQPNGSLTREQMAKVEVVALGLQTEANALSGQEPNYSDAGSIGKWAWGYVNEATHIGILQGFADGSFGPTETFTTDQASDALTELTSYLAAHAQPTVTAVLPSTGAGGASVAVSGAGFCGATGVSFGTVAATSFTVNSTGSITAVAPAGSGTVDVTVTTPNGTSVTSSSDQFAYTTSGGGTPPASGGGGSPPAVQTATPTINTPIDAADTSISGTSVANATIVLSVNGTAQPSVLANSIGDWTVSGLTLQGSDAISVTAQASGESVSAPATATVLAPLSVEGITLSMSGGTQSSYAATGSGGTWTVTVPWDSATTIGSANYTMTSATVEMTGAKSQSYDVVVQSGTNTTSGTPYGTLSYSGSGDAWTLTPAAPQTFETPGTWVLSTTVEDTAGNATSLTLTLTVPSPTLYVGPDGSDTIDEQPNMCTDASHPCATVDQAIYAADYFGGNVTIDIEAGTYEQQIVVAPGSSAYNEDPETQLGPLTGLVLAGSGQASTTFELPSSPATTEVGSWTDTMYGLLATPGAPPVTVQDLALDGTNSIEGCGQNPVGIVFLDSSGTVKDVTTTNWIPPEGLTGCQSGVGVAFVNDSANPLNAEVENSTISNYGKAGIVAKGAGTNLQAQGNTVTGNNPDSGTNGIEVAYGATGTITGNTVSANDFTQSLSPAFLNETDPQADYASGILLYSASGMVEVSGNTLTDDQIGIQSVATNMTAETNTIANPGVDASIGIYAVPCDQYCAAVGVTPGGNFTDVISRNTITGIPWWIYSYTGTTPATFSAGIWAGNAGSFGSNGRLTTTIDGNQVNGGWMGIVLGPDTGGNIATVTDNTVQNFQRNGINVGAWYLGGHGIDATISGNTVTGIGAGPSNTDDWAQNGIETGNGATGSITDNHLTGFVFTAYNNPGQVGATDTAIMVWDNSDQQVVGNTINDSQTAISLYSDDTAWNPSDDQSVNDVVENNIVTYDPAYNAPFLLSNETYGTEGIGIAAYASPGLDAPVSVTVEGNKLEGPNSVAGAYDSVAIHIGDVPANSPAGSVSVAGLGDNTIDSNWTYNLEGPVYAVHYDPNGATSGTVSQDVYSYTPGSTVTVLDNTGNLALTGNSFSGWNTAADGSGTNFSAGSHFAITGDMTLYAMWTPELSSAPTAAASTDAVGDTTITASAASGDTLTVQVSASSIPTPVVGSPAPTSGSGVTANYTSGTDLAATSGDYVGVYEVNGSGDVVAFSLVGPLDASDLGQAAPAITTIAATYGSASGTTAINVTPNTAGDTFLVQDVGTTPTATPLVGSTPPGGATTYTPGSDLAVNANDLVDVYEVNGGKIVAFTELTITSGSISP